MQWSPFYSESASCIIQFPQMEPIYPSSSYHRGQPLPRNAFAIDSVNYIPPSGMKNAPLVYHPLSIDDVISHMMQWKFNLIKEFWFTPLATIVDMLDSL